MELRYVEDRYNNDERENKYAKRRSQLPYDKAINE